MVSDFSIFLLKNEMKFLDFCRQMRAYPLFTVHDTRLIFPRENIHTTNTQLSNWAKQKKIVKLRNGLYALSSDYAKEPLAPEVIAAKLYAPSYISLQYALSLYGIIPDAVFEITSVTTKSTRFFKTPFGNFRYRKIKTSCFFGFAPLQHGKLSSYLASPEKALVDLLYLNSRWLKPEYATWKELRLQNLIDIDFGILKKIAKKFKNNTLLSCIDNLETYATSH